MFTTEHERMRAQVTRFVEREINPHVPQWEEEGRFPAHELFKKMGELGYLGVTKSIEDGGLGLDLTYSVVMAEALATAHCGGVPLAIGVQTDMCTPALAHFGSEELRERFLRPSIRGELVGCLGVSEPSAGSDVAAIRTYARSDGDDYVISGQKMWITNGAQADWMCALVNTSPVSDSLSAHHNKSLIIIPLKERGVHVERTLDKMGMRSSDTAQLSFDEVRVPQRFLIGEREGLGFAQQMAQFQDERLWGAANAAANLEIALELTADYLRDRKAFGKPLISQQVIHLKLAELSTEVQALKALTYRAVGLHVERGASDPEVIRLASMAKLKSGRLSRALLDECVQFHGGMGYMSETRINRMYRDMRVLSIGGGADEVMLGVIAKLEGLHAPRRDRGKL